MAALTVVVPTRNRPGLLADTVASLQAQTVDVEIVVVDDGSHPAAVVPDSVTLIRHDTVRGLNAARNSGARAAASPLLWFVDDDIEAPAGWAEAIIEGAARFPDGWCYGGPIRLRVEGTTRRQCARCGTGWETELDLGTKDLEIDSYVYGANIGATKTALDHVPFDEQLPIYFEEIQWQDNIRAAGGNVVYLADAWLWHRRTGGTATLRHRLRRAYKQGRSSYRYDQQKGATGRPLDHSTTRNIAHTLRRRCQTGLILIAVDAGRTTEKLRRRKNPSR